jgi:hypothetical protein
MKRLMIALVVFALPASAMADLTWYITQADFETGAAGAGYTLSGVETFEENTAGGLVPVAEPLAYKTPNGAEWPTGLDERMAVQANTLGADPFEPSPHGGADGMFIIPGGSGFGESSDIVLGNYFPESVDLMFAEYGGYFAVGFNTVQIFGDSSVDLRVYGLDNTLLGQAGSLAHINGSYFVGVVSDTPIGRLNIYNNGAEGADNIQLWTPEPASLLLVLLGGMIGMRRR